MLKDKLKHHAFTLTELLVVIAIIAILAAVLIPSLLHFVERAQLSSDRQKAAHMTQIIQWHLMENPDDQNATLSAYDVRRIINDTTEESISFTPRTPHAGFFYVDGSLPRIEVRYYIDVYQSYVSTNDTETYYLKNIMEPSQVFGDVLLTDDGSPIAKLIHSMHHRTQAEELFNILNHPREWRPYNESIHNLLSTMVDSNHPYTFHPDHVAYVTHTDWLLPEGKASRIVFMPGLSHIPSFHDDLSTLNQSHITIPSNVKTVEGNAFTHELFAQLTIEYDGGTPLKVEKNAFFDSHLKDLNTTKFSETDLIDMSHQLSYDEHGIDFSNLTLEETVNAIMVEYQTHKTQKNIIVRLYTVSGLIGKAVFSE